MTSNQAILEAAIAKAIEGGWDMFGWIDAEPTVPWHVGLNEWDDINLVIEQSIDDYIYFHPSVIIFDHDFAKALWGEKRKIYDKEVTVLPGVMVTDSGAVVPRKSYTYNTYRMEKGWQYHLQQMVIADDPIKYLGEHI